MTYSYTQISQYLACPRRYRHRYLDGWQEKDTRAAMLFGRAFEQSLAALFRREDPAAVLFERWGVCKDMGRVNLICRLRRGWRMRTRPSWANRSSNWMPCCSMRCQVSLPE